MKGTTKKQKFWAILGAGLLVAAASGSAFAMRTAEERDTRSSEIQQEKKSSTQTSPLPTPTSQPTLESEREVEFTGTVEVIASDMWVVSGRTVVVTAGTEIKSGLSIGVLAKVHAVSQADGTLLAREIEPVEGNDNGNSNSNSNDNGNSNDDNGNDNNGNVNSNDANGNDDNGNSNVNTNDDNGNDDHGGNGNVNANDSNGNDDHGGNGNDNHGGSSHGG